MHEKILVIDDEEDFRTVIGDYLAHAGYEVILAEDGEKGVELFRKRKPHLVLCDRRLPSMDGFAVIKAINEIDGTVPVIMLTAYTSRESVREAANLGAAYHITKPFNMPEVELIINKALEARSLQVEADWLRDSTLRSIEKDLVGITPRMREMIKLVAKVAESDAPTILLQGESGTGKNFVAKLIHLKSRRSKYPFMEINCASLPEALIESELFGHGKGAFTDAKEVKQGLFEVANGGTVFLDEISEMSIPTQAKLLHVIEGRRFRRVGGIEDMETNVRVIAAASMNLNEAIEQKRFREDLFFRLNLIPLIIPPLRERTEDIPLLVANFIQRFNREYRKNITGITPTAETLLKKYRWPGNIRELRNVIERISILEDNISIGIDHLPPEIRAAGPPAKWSEGNSKQSVDIEANSNYAYPMPDGGLNLDEVQKQFLTQALKKTDGNQSRAAKLLGISRHTLRYRLVKFGIP